MPFVLWAMLETSDRNIYDHGSSVKGTGLLVLGCTSQKRIEKANLWNAPYAERMKAQRQFLEVALINRRTNIVVVCITFRQKEEFSPKSKL